MSQFFSSMKLSQDMKRKKTSKGRFFYYLELQFLYLLLSFGANNKDYSHKIRVL